MAADRDWAAAALELAGVLQAIAWRKRELTLLQVQREELEVHMEQMLQQEQQDAAGDQLRRL